jgi:hypothetical protein
MFLKIHRATDGSEVVAVCDRELIDTVLIHGELSIAITRAFYGATQASEGEVETALRTADNVNLMGERAVGVAKRLGLIDPSHCVLIGHVPHAQIIRI